MNISTDNYVTWDEQFRKGIEGIHVVVKAIVDLYGRQVILSDKQLDMYGIDATVLRPDARAVQIEVKNDVKSAETGNFFFERRVVYQPSGHEEKGWTLKVTAEFVFMRSPGVGIAIVPRDFFYRAEPIIHSANRPGAITTRNGKTWRAYGDLVRVSEVRKYAIGWWAEDGSRSQMPIEDPFV